MPPKGGYSNPPPFFGGGVIFVWLPMGPLCVRHQIWLPSDLPSNGAPFCSIQKFRQKYGNKWIKYYICLQMKPTYFTYKWGFLLGALYGAPFCVVSSWAQFYLSAKELFTSSECVSGRGWMQGKCLSLSRPSFILELINQSLQFLCSVFNWFYSSSQLLPFFRKDLILTRNISSTCTTKLTPVAWVKANFLSCENFQFVKRNKSLSKNGFCPYNFFNRERYFDYFLIVFIGKRGSISQHQGTCPITGYDTGNYSRKNTGVCIIVAGDTLAAHSPQP